MESLSRISSGLLSGLASVFLVSNLMALFLVASLMGLVWYTVVVNNTQMTTAIIGFASSIIGAVTGFYFNKDQLARAQREQAVQGDVATGYSEIIRDLESRNAVLELQFSDMVELIEEIEAEEEAG